MSFSAGGARSLRAGKRRCRRERTTRRRPPPLETTGPRIRKKKKKKKKKIASCVFYSTHTHTWEHAPINAQRTFVLATPLKKTIGVRSNAESRASMSTPLLPHRGGGVCPSKPNPPIHHHHSSQLELPKEEREKERN